MKRAHLVIVLCSVVTLFIGGALVASQGAGVATAQGADPAAVSVTAATVSSGISYQGVLREAGSPVTGSRNFTFRFFTDAACTAQVGAIIVEAGVAVNNGLFSVKLDVDPALFDGQGLWLGVDVGGTPTACEEITPAPYALSLRPGATIVGSSADAPILSVTNDYEAAARAASVAGGNSDGLVGYSKEGVGVIGRSVGSRGVSGLSDSGDGVFGSSLTANGGSFSTYGANAYGVEAQNLGGGKAARFVGGVDISGDLNLTGEVYAQSLHTKDGSGATTSGVNTAGEATFKRAQITNPTGGSTQINETGFQTSDAVGPTSMILPSGDAIFQSVSASSLSAQVQVETPSLLIQDGSRNTVASADTNGNITAKGKKSAVVPTINYGERTLYVDESAEIYFFDRGQGQLTAGVVTIPLDPIWLETVTIDATHPMLVQVTLTGDCKGVYVAEKTATGFTVRELQGGTSSATFDWEVAAKRKGYEDVRLEQAAIN